MNLKKFLTGILMLTVVALIYIQMQVNIYALAYETKNSEKEVLKLVDDNGYVTYNIARLKSASHLGDHLLNDNSEIDFLDFTQVVQLKGLPQLAAKAESAKPTILQKTTKFLASVFSLKSVAEARPIQ